MSEQSAEQSEFQSLHVSIFWDLDRHRAVAMGAEESLTPHARAAVEKITAKLGKGQTLADLAGWADMIKGGGTGDDEDTRAFLGDARNANHRNWHFVNLPLEAKAYDRERYPEFTREDDVVQMIGICSAVLAGTSDRMSRLNALRMVVHLVGDVHQPLHVACAYLDISAPRPRLVQDPDEIRRLRLQSDRGGNLIVLPVQSARQVSLHSYWDGGLTRSLHGAPPGTAEGSVAAKPEWSGVDLGGEAAKIDGFTDASSAAASWASEAIVAAKEAYRSLEADRTLPGGKVAVRWEGKSAYDTRCRPIVAQQLKRGSRNLAALLNTLLSS